MADEAKNPPSHAPARVLTKGESAAVWFPAADLHPWPDNPRDNDGEPPERVADSIQAFGWGRPVLAREENREVIGGHTALKSLPVLLERFEAATPEDLADPEMWDPEAIAVCESGLVPVRFLDRSEAKAHLLAVADNRTAEFSRWSVPKLERVAASFTPVQFERSGWKAPEFRKLVASSGTGVEIEEPPTPEPPKVPVTKLGDVWEMGAHRLVCGDSTSTEVTALACGGDQASLYATDPPYGVAYNDETGAGTRDTIANDENDGEKLQGFLEAVFRASGPSLRLNAAWYLWHAQLTQGFFAAAAAAAGLLIHRQIIWVKPSLVLGHGDYHWRHELCFYGWRSGHRCPWYGDRKQTSVWEIGREDTTPHPTQKPVEVFARPMLFNTLKGELCLEPFGGSGSQLIAAEQTERRSATIEFEPKWCDVIIERWENLTGGKAKRVRRG